MDYFELTLDPLLSNPIQIQHADPAVYKNVATWEEFDAAPKMIVGRFDNSPQAELRDLSSQPAFLISDNLKRLFALYDPEMPFKGIRVYAKPLYTYQGNWSEPVSFRAAEGDGFRYAYDAADRLVAKTHREKASGFHNRTRFSYDKAGNLVEITDNQGRWTLIEYDLLNREIRRIEKDGGITRSFYNGNGRLSKVVRPNPYNPQTDGGAGYQYTYDHRGLVLTVIGPDGQIPQTNTYDADGTVTKFVYSPLDLLTEVWDDGHKLAAYTYNVGGAVQREVHGPIERQFQYDRAGNLLADDQL